jgi:hypothetical protein
MSAEEKKRLQGLRASYKLEDVLDFDGTNAEVSDLQRWDGDGK